MKITANMDTKDEKWVDGFCWGIALGGMCVFIIMLIILI